MPVDLALVGRSTEPFPVAWTAKDVMLYAVAVGAGADDAGKELPYTTENTAGVELQVLPTFAVTIGFDGPRVSIGDIDRTKLVHGEQALRVLRPLPPEGSGTMTRKLEAIYDKGSGALFVMRTQLADATGEPLVEIRSGVFVRGETGFGGERGPKTEWAIPDRAPDHMIEQRTQSNQALLYRLTGDRNPLHSDPAFAAHGGFPRPILHGLCTYGFAGRAIAALAEGKSKLNRLSVRFSSPVMPGDTLTTTVWIEGGTAVFRTAVGGRIVLDHGTAEMTA